MICLATGYGETADLMSKIVSLYRQLRMVIGTRQYLS
jgi:hypothetical protein